MCECMSMEKVGDGAVVEHSSLPREDYIYIAGVCIKYINEIEFCKGAPTPLTPPPPPAL